MNSTSKSKQRIWFPHKIIQGEGSPAVLILNHPLQERSKEYVNKIWKSAAVRVAVDGGASILKESFGEKSEFVPDIVCGDFDSVTADVLNFYEQKGAKIVHTPDQNETDFAKALRLTVEHIDQNNLQVSAIIALISVEDSRIDHTFSNFNALYLCENLTNIPVFLLGSQSLTWLLSSGSHIVYISKELMNFHMGLIPLGKECKDVSTAGLKWNLAHDQMNFGGLISTCNKFNGSDEVTVDTDAPLIWTMEIATS